MTHAVGWTLKPNYLPVFVELACLLTLRKGIQAFEPKSLRKLLRTAYLEHKANDWVWGKMNFPVGPQELLSVTVKKQKLEWFEHVTRHDRISKTILQGTLEGG